ncbi:major facilitator superfamily domain-containing protein, partial [Jimgerdemannia flammicorona]
MTSTDNRSLVETVVTTVVPPAHSDVDITLAGDQTLPPIQSSEANENACDEYVYGIYAMHFIEMYPDESALSISFVGSLSAGITYAMGMVAGMITDRCGYRTTGLVGSVIAGVACILASFATKGVLFGVGTSLVYFPAVSAPSQWFPPNKRGLAMGISVSGVGIGGLFMASLTQLMINNIGVAWALRTTGIICFVFMGGASLLVCERHADVIIVPSSAEKIEDQPEKASASDELARSKTIMAILKELDMICLFISEFSSSFGHLIPFYFISS